MLNFTFYKYSLYHLAHIINLRLNAQLKFFPTSLANDKTDSVNLDKEQVVVKNKMVLLTLYQSTLINFRLRLLCSENEK